MVGASFTELTVNVKDVDVTTVPSPTLMVMVVVPLWPAAGVIVTVRSDPLPRISIFPLGTREVRLEVPVTIRLAAGVSASPILNAMGGVAVFSAVL